MSKFFTIFLSALLLTQSTHIDFDDIVQFDELIEHAKFHKAEYGDNFLVFISKHYGELKSDHSQNHQEEEKDHEQLPFQCHDHMLSLTAFVMQDIFLDLHAVDIPELRDSNFYYQSSLSSLHKQGLLQPPKHA